MEVVELAGFLVDGQASAQVERDCLLGVGEGELVEGGRQAWRGWGRGSGLLGDSGKGGVGVEQV